MAGVVVGVYRSLKCFGIYLQYHFGKSSIFAAKGTKNIQIRQIKTAYSADLGSFYPNSAELSALQLPNASAQVVGLSCLSC